MITTTSANNSPILIVANAVSGGGAEKSMLALHSKLIEKSFDSYFLALNYNDQKHLETTNVISLNRKWRSGIKETLLNFLEFKNIIKKICPKIVILNCELPELYGSFLFLRNCRVICVEHTSNPWYRRKYIGIIVRSILKLKKIEWVTVVSNQKKIWLGDLNPKYIPNPFIKNKSCKADKHQPPSLTFIGGLKTNKRAEWVIKAGLNQKLKVNIYGDGPLKEILEVKYKSKRNKIKFHGFNPNVWELVPSNSLVIVPSEFEGDGMVVVEAILSGKPIALARNQDLLRFNLDDKNYFSDLNELFLLIEKNINNNFFNLKVPNKIFQELKGTRSLNKVYSQWVDFLGMKQR